MTSIPLMVDLKEKRVIVVGGGKVAQRRISTIINTGASIVVISPHITPVINEWYQQDKIEWLEKEFSVGDLDDAFLTIIATNNSTINKMATESAPKQTLINAVEDAELGNTKFPIHLKRGRLSIAISTGGASPILAKKIKHQLNQTYDERYESYLDFLFEARSLIKQTSLPIHKKKELLQKLVSDDFLTYEEQQHELLALKKEINN
ncbi:NAD(P)-binding protein [Aquibacillus rhizosphaerae]|uniref:precorrin-2 dehydrogenase n=1 Tax=Aquibacillus rhizosphaerae TaxID=3051431 RepID=A0ABT7LCF7_9BACI|nr:NAD(P)-binding protein [Aquibacillus sp. LR5S19]MDL4842241.1 NAD(P)-binding protein [Aquibacillus sp. LR5S19]